MKLATTQPIHKAIILPALPDTCKHTPSSSLDLTWISPFFPWSHSPSVCMTENTDSLCGCPGLETLVLRAKQVGL